MSTLTRSVPFTIERASDDGDGLTLTGYAAVFDKPTRIDSWEGKFDEQIARGAFAASLKRRTPKLQFDHGQHPLVGSMPLGVISKMREDEHGLFVEARLHDNWLIEPVRDAIASGSVDGMSFRFRAIGEMWDESGDVPVRTLTEVELLEAGPVVWPAYEETSVGVRSSELAHLFDLPEEQRTALARALVLGDKSSVAVSQEGDKNDPDEGDEQAVSRSNGMDANSRSRVLALLNITEG